MKKILLVFGLVLVVEGLQAETKTAIVTATTLKMRATPSLKGEMVATVPRATIVEVLGYTQNPETIDGVNSPWVNIKLQTDGKTGWVFGAFVATSYQILNTKKGLMSWINSSIPEKGPASCEVSLYDAGTKKQTKISVETEICDKFGFSQDLKYLAIDDGTYAYGALHVYRMRDKKLLHTFEYFPREIEWTGNTLKFNEVLCDKEGDIKSEANSFNNGKVQRSLEAKRKAECG